MGGGGDVISIRRCNDTRRGEREEGLVILFVRINIMKKYDL